MNKSCTIRTVALVSLLLVGSARAEGASEAAYLACKEKVNAELEAAQAKGLGPKVAAEVDGLCRQGRTEEALRFAFPMQAKRDCVNRVRQEAAAPDSKLGKDEIGEAHNLCRQGDVDAAFAILDGSSGNGPAAELPGFPDVLSLSFSPQNIRAGEATTLRWNTSGASSVEVGRRNPQWPHASSEPILDPQTVGPSGSIAIQPSATVTYQVRAIGGAGKSASKEVTVVVSSVPQPAATCSISGRITGKLKWDTQDDRGQPISFDLTHVYGWEPGADRPVSAEVRGRRFTFEGVPAGKSFTIRPGGYRSNPRERTLSCVAGTAQPGANFEITGPPPSG